MPKVTQPVGGKPAQALRPVWPKSCPFSCQTLYLFQRQDVLTRLWGAITSTLEKKKFVYFKIITGSQKAAKKKKKVALPNQYHIKPRDLTLVQSRCSVVCDSLQPHGLQPARLLCPWNSPGKNTEAGCHFLFQGIFSTQRSNLRLLSLLPRRQILYAQSPGKPRVYSDFTNFTIQVISKLNQNFQGKQTSKTKANNFLKGPSDPLLPWTPECSVMSGAS